MKPAPFVYFRPASLDEALAHLAEVEGAKVLAGGQSLVPAMNFRIAQPAALVDINRVAGLSSIEARADGGLRIGGLVRHRALETSAEVARHAPLVAEAMPLVAHPPIRTRGTLGGSLAHADPAAELPAVMLALDATFTAVNRMRARTIAAADFFLGLYATALEPDEILTDIAIPPLPRGAGWAIDEFARRHGDYALAGAAAILVTDDRGTCTAARIGLMSAHDRPVLAAQAAARLVGHRLSPEALADAADTAAAVDADPSGDIHASADYRRHLVGVMVRRVLARAAARASGARP
ncbi:MAG: xanthine dehydrogenase family protein subunit M [Acidobacteriota bacterium]